jgi:PP-loop superfamily ATP-utilizing enzyme
MIFVQRRIKKIMTIKVRDKRELALRELAMKLGCSLSSSYTPDGKHIEEEIIRRIQEAARSIRESRLWLIALISAIASVFSCY